jgi:hypothetical protein
MVTLLSCINLRLAKHIFHFIQKRETSNEGENEAAKREISEQFSSARW